MQNFKVAQPCKDIKSATAFFYEAQSFTKRCFSTKVTRGN